jgi:hypothetical protein
VGEDPQNRGSNDSGGTVLGFTATKVVSPFIARKHDSVSSAVRSGSWSGVTGQRFCITITSVTTYNSISCAAESVGATDSRFPREPTTSKVGWRSTSEQLVPGCWRMEACARSIDTQPAQGKAIAVTREAAHAG